MLFVVELKVSHCETVVSVEQLHSGQVVVVVEEQEFLPSSKPLL